MKRREFVSLAGGVAGWAVLGGETVATSVISSPSRAATSNKDYLVGHLAAASEVSRRSMVAAFLDSMRELGHIEGANFKFVSRYANGDFSRLPELARELLTLRPDVLFVETTPANLAAKAVTTTVPIVMVAVADPIGVGLIASLANPGGNVTGVTNIAAELAGKRLEILKEIIPDAARIAVLINPNDQNASLQMRSAETVADKLSITLDPIVNIQSASDLEPGFKLAIQAGAQGALRMTDPVEISLSKQTAELQLKYRLPVIHPTRSSVQSGGLASYGTNLPAQFRQAATYVDKILHGVKPADLPVEQPTKFDFVINLRTAKALGLRLSPTLLARADDVVE